MILKPTCLQNGSLLWIPSATCGFILNYTALVHLVTEIGFHNLENQHPYPFPSKKSCRILLCCQMNPHVSKVGSEILLDKVNMWQKEGLANIIRYNIQRCHLFCNRYKRLLVRMFRSLLIYFINFFRGQEPKENRYYVKGFVMNRFFGEDLQHEFKGHRNFTHEQIPIIARTHQTQRPISRYYFGNCIQNLQLV